MHFTQIRDVYEPTDNKKKIRMEIGKNFFNKKKLLSFVKVSGNGT
jgi:hypothetical protein